MYIYSVIYWSYCIPICHKVYARFLCCLWWFRNVVSFLVCQLNKISHMVNDYGILLSNFCTLVHPIKHLTYSCAYCNPWTAHSRQTFPVTICWSVCPVDCGKTTDRIQIRFGRVGWTGPGTWQIVGFDINRWLMGKSDHYRTLTLYIQLRGLITRNQHHCLETNAISTRRTATVPNCTLPQEDIFTTYTSKDHTSMCFRKSVL